jgi:drug/metabolite transporter (DMT)-like permease
MNKNKMPAILGLLIATTIWGSSFVLFRTILLYAQKSVGNNEEFFQTFSLFNVGYRFLLASIGIFCIALWVYKKNVYKITRHELIQSLLLTITGGTAVLLQMYSLRITQASTSAFLTQAYCMLIPWLSWWRRGSKINTKTFCATILVLISLKLITGFSLQTLEMGKGEILTLIAAFLFSFQILCFEEECYKENRSLITTTLMFFFTGAILLFISSFSLAQMYQHNYPLYQQFIAIQTNPQVSLIILFMIMGPTIFAFWSMAHWQPKISATHAGLIYCVEPIWASIFAVYFPRFLAPWIGVDYPAEFFTPNLLWGAVLMTIAQILIILK